MTTSVDPPPAAGSAHRAPDPRPGHHPAGAAHAGDPPASLAAGTLTRRRVDVLDSWMSYLDSGEGPVMLFLHGNPTSSYLWRNVIPQVSGEARCIAVDLIGMGESGKPALDYRFTDHARYLESFIETLDLRDITLVLHDWGSALGFDYARRHPARVRGLAFMEAIVAPVEDWDSFPAQVREMFRAFRDPVVGPRLLIEENAFIEKVLPSAVLRTLSPEELDAYRRPFLDPAHRTPVWRWPNEIPIAGQPADVAEIVAGYAAWLARSPIPKLLLSADPGALIPPALARTLAARLPELTHVELGPGLHYVQEDHPEAIGRAVAAWHATLTGTRNPSTMEA